MGFSNDTKRSEKQEIRTISNQRETIDTTHNGKEIMKA